MMETKLEHVFLKQAVERKFANRLTTSADFVRLSEDMDDRVSPSTLKRLWGYVGMQVEPRPATLDALSKYVGFRDYRAFLEDLRSSRMASSGYFNSARLDAATLQSGDMFKIEWRPDRIVTLRYLCGISSEHSKLREGDEFEAPTIMKGFPLILPEIIRNGEKTSSYIAGRDGGIVFIVSA